MLQRKKVSATLTVMLLAIALNGQPLSALGAPKVLTDQDMLSHPFPPYPGQALLNHESAWVLLRVTIENGRVMDVVAVSGPSQFTSVSVGWVKATWKFKPYVNGIYKMPIYFGRNWRRWGGTYMRIREKSPSQNQAPNH
jgi:hypothetical protein